MAERVAFRTCPLCEATCGLRIELEDERVTRIRGDLEDPLSQGFVCPKGTTLARLHEDPDRLRTPMVKRNGRHVPCTWEEAYSEVAGRLNAIVSDHGSEAVGVYVGNPNAHNYESNLALRPFIKTLRTRHVYSASTVDQMPKQVACGHVFGHPFTIPVPDVDRTDHLLILGANPLESNGSLATAPDWPGRLEDLIARGGALVVVDPRRTKTAELATRHVPIRPGTDAMLLAAMANVVFGRGDVELGHLDGHVAGLDQVREAVGRFTPEVVAGPTGIASDIITTMAHELADAPTAAVYGRIGTHTTEFGTLAAWLVDVLNLATGNLDRPGGAMFAKALHEPERRKRRGFTVGRWKSRVHGMPEIMGELPVTTLADEITTDGVGRLRALFTVAGNPVLTTPDAGALDGALERLDFMVSVDPYLNATTRHADVILPPPSALERGHWDFAFQTLSLRDYGDWSPPVFEPDGPSEFAILVTLTAIAAGLGPDADPTVVARSALEHRVTEATTDPASPIHGRDPVEILASLDDRPVDLQSLDLMIRLGHRGDHFGARPDGLTLASFEAHPHGLDLGPLVPRLPGEITTESGHVEIGHPLLIADLDRLWARLEDSRPGQMVLVGRRQVRTANSWTHNIEVLVKGRNRCTLQMHPDDAARLGVSDGEQVVVVSETGSVDVPVEVTDAIMAGVVSIPYGWGHGADGTMQSVASRYAGVNVNLLTPKVMDPLSGNAQLNGIPVRIRAAAGELAAPEEALAT